MARGAALGYRPRQFQVRQALAELALVHRRVEHAAALDYLATKMKRSVAASTMRNAKRARNFLPPGCRMTATHFEFT